ncbi:MAG: hypothetical protein PUE01_01240 [Clostridiaceae bacterium]|nr:hypothetical protein [Clostridiaceae bacterium]
MNNEERLFFRELLFAKKRIREWYKKSTKHLTILTSPYNSNLIFKDIILECVKNKKNVLYLWKEGKINKNIVDSLKLVRKNLSVGCYDGDYNITFGSYEEIERIKGNFELVIFDDISSHSKLSVGELKNIYVKCSKLGKKVILYSLDDVIIEGEWFNLAPLSLEKPFVEPRIINTRVNLSDDIPYSLYEYLKWFRDEKKKVILYVPDDKKLENVFDYFINKVKMKNVKIIKSTKEDVNLKRKVLNLKDKAIFIVTNYIEGDLKQINADEAIILFAENSRYTYRNFVYICGGLQGTRERMPEMIMVSKDISNDMDKAKSLTRSFNKMIWEKKLISL